MTDTIFIRGLVIHARHGVMEHETEVGQRVVIDLELSSDLSESSRTDRLASLLPIIEQGGPRWRDAWVEAPDSDAGRELAPLCRALNAALVTALRKTGGDTNTNKLIQTMEGMSFETPKGKMTFRKEDHQAMQNMYEFRIKDDPAFAWGVPELVRVITPAEMDIPILNHR